MLKCTNCEKECKNKAGLTIHMNKCKKIENICEFCKHTFATIYSLKRHLEETKCNKQELIEEEKETYLSLQNKIKQYEEQINNLNNDCNNKIKRYEDKIEILNVKNMDLMNENKLLSQKFTEETIKLEKDKELLNNHLSKLNHNLSNISESNKVLSNKVGKNITNNNINSNNNNQVFQLQFNKEIAGDIMDDLHLTGKVTVKELGKLISEELAKRSGVYISDIKRKTLTYVNEHDKEIKDEKGKNMAEIWNKEERCINKINEWNQATKDELKHTFNTYEIEELKQIQTDQAKIKENSMVLQEQINEHLPTKYNKKFHLSNWYNQLKSLIIKYPSYLLININDFSDFLIQQKLVHPDNFRVLDDNKKLDKLKADELIYLFKTLNEELNLVNSYDFVLKLLNSEMKRLYYSSKIDKCDYNNIVDRITEKIENTLKWLSSDIKREDIIITDILNNLYSYEDERNNFIKNSFNQ